MKNKHILLSIVSTVAFFSAPLSASGAPSSAPDVIEIYNKSNESIQVNIADASGSIRKDITTAYVSPGQPWRSGHRVIDMNSKLLIEVSTKANPKLQKFMISAPGKTKYLSWDSTKSMPLYPQTGPLMGLMGTTKSGLSLKNNVSSSQIQAVK